MQSLITLEKALLEIISSLYGTLNKVLLLLTFQQPFQAI